MIKVTGDLNDVNIFREIINNIIPFMNSAWFNANGIPTNLDVSFQTSDKDASEQTFENETIKLNWNT